VGLSREAEDNATSHGLHRIPPPAEAGGFQTAGLNHRDDLYEKCFARNHLVILRRPLYCILFS
jgi:hypothetical protein